MIKIWDNNMGYIPILYGMMLTVFVSYVSFIWIKYGIQKSISNSYYVLPTDLRFLMTFFCWLFAIPAMIIGSTPLMFLAGAGICFVGAAAAFKEEMTHNVHMIGACGGVALSQISTIVDFHMWYMTAIFVVLSLLMILFRKQLKYKQIWWIEILAFTSICVTLGIARL